MTSQAALSQNVRPAAAARRPVSRRMPAFAPQLALAADHGALTLQEARRGVAAADILAVSQVE